MCTLRLGSLDPHKSSPTSPQTESRSVLQFAQLTVVTNIQTDRATPSVAVGRTMLRKVMMRRNNNGAYGGVGVAVELVVLSR